MWKELTYSNVRLKFGWLEDDCVSRVSRKSASSPNKPIIWVDQPHHDDWVKILIVIVFLTWFGTTRRALDGNVASVHSCPTARELPKLFHVNHFLFKLFFWLWHMFGQALIPWVFHNCLCYLVYNRAYCGNSESGHLRNSVVRISSGKSVQTNCQPTCRWNRLFVYCVSFKNMSDSKVFLNRSSEYLLQT